MADDEFVQWKSKLLEAGDNALGVSAAFGVHFDGRTGFRACRGRCFDEGGGGFFQSGLTCNFDEPGPHGRLSLQRLVKSARQLIHEPRPRGVRVHIGVIQPEVRRIVFAQMKAGAGDDVHAAGLGDSPQSVAIATASPRLAIHQRPPARPPIVL